MVLRHLRQEVLPRYFRLTTQKEKKKYCPVICCGNSGMVVRVSQMVYESVCMSSESNQFLIPFVLVVGTFDY